MSSIRMETEKVRDSARQIDFAVQELSMKPRRLKSAANSLKSAWRSRQATRFADELKRKAAILDNEVANLQQLAQRMRNEVSEWEGADSLGAQERGQCVDLSIGIGIGIIQPEDSFYPPGLLDEYRIPLKNIFSPETGEIIKWATLVEVLIPTWIGTLIVIGTDGIGGVNDFMVWAIRDWENYDTFGEEIAATLFDARFAYYKTKIIISIDALGLITDTLDLAGLPGYIVSTGAGAVLWSVVQGVDWAADEMYSLSEDWGIKEAYIGSLGDAINKARKLFDSSFDPYKDQIMTNTSGGYSGSW
jgi:uncharacterized protein YukE